MDKLIPLTDYARHENWGAPYFNVHSGLFDKVAGEVYIPPELDAFIKTCKPRDDGRYLLAVALGSYEGYGFNANGDSFPEWSLRGDPAPEWITKAAAKAGMKTASEYGMQTFPKHGKVFKNHRNKPTDKSYGKICAAAYNDKMRRGELVIFISKTAAPELVQRIDNGDLLAFSMGSRVPYDVCSRSGCHNHARNRSEYCDHAKFAMNQVHPNGEKNGVHNPFNTFFDFSEVWVPADETALGLRKVANYPMPAPPVGLHPDAKSATMEKEVPAVSVGGSGLSPEEIEQLKNLVGPDLAGAQSLPPGLMDDLAACNPEDVISSAAALGIPLKPEEAAQICAQLSETAAANPKQASPRIMAMLRPYVPSRSMFPEHLVKRAARNQMFRASRPKIASATYRLYAKVATAFSTADLAAAYRNPKIALAADPTTIARAMFGGEVQAPVDPRAYVAAIAWNL